jgi:hypothetical protein
MKASSRIHSSAVLSPGKELRNLFDGVWVDPQRGQDNAKKKVRKMPTTGLEPRLFNTLLIVLA